VPQVYPDDRPGNLRNGFKPAIGPHALPVFARFQNFHLQLRGTSRNFPAMHSLRIQLTALLLAVAFVIGFMHCTLDTDCLEDGAASSLCQTCWCHTPVVSEIAVMVPTPSTRLIEPFMETFRLNGRLAAVSIFNPPKA